MLSKNITPLLLFVLLLTACSQEEQRNRSVAGGQDDLVVFLVRHGEKVDHSHNPDLSPAGYVRAATLAQTLRNCEIEHVHSSDFTRTRKTAEPVASIHGVHVELYAPSDLKALAEKLSSSGGRHLVVGHSDTTPRLVELLGGEAGQEMIESREYDGLYVLIVQKDGSVNTLLLRYGVPYVPEY